MAKCIICGKPIDVYQARKEEDVRKMTRKKRCFKHRNV
jgi:hypothetical protein